jgi:predicted dehydrogenase/glycosyltransferase involved in cell wall biosynthesis/NADPH:quinone reductase-like Zn-dependent oxidoreductase
MLQPPPQPVLVILATDSPDPSGVGHHMMMLAQSGSGRFATRLAFADNPAGRRFVAKARAQGLVADTVSDWPHWLAQAGAHLLHIHAGIGWEGHAIARAGRTLGLPVVRTEHLPWLITDPAQRARYRAGLPGVSHLICVSESSADTWRAELAYLPRPLTIHHIPNGITPAPARSPRDATRAALGIDPASPLILHVGRFAPQKDHATLVAAFAELRDTRPDAQLALVGTGDSEPDIREQVAARHRDGVHFLGLRDDVADLMQAADVLALPSRFEGLPLVLLEAMEAGLPVVATRIGGVTEALGPDHPWLVPQGSVTDLTRALDDALTDAALRQEVIARQATRFADRFTATRMSADTERVYDAALAPPEARPAPTEKTRIGFIGAGGIAARHLGVLARMSDVTIAAIADPDLARATALADTCGATPFADHDAMLATTRLDALFICVPPFAHGPAERAAIAHKLPFFVEKPITLDVALAEQIAAEVATAGLITAVGYHWRYLDTVDHVRQQLAQTPAQVISGAWLDSTPPPAWWHDAARSGGQVVEQATHLIDLARVLAGDVTRVSAMANRIDRPDFPGLTVPTGTVATLQFGDGAVGTLQSTCLLRWQHRVALDIYADGLAISLTDHDLMIDTGHGRPVTPAHGDPVWREDRDFIDAVQGRPNHIRTPYAEALATHRTALAIASAAQTGDTVAIPPPDHPPHRFGPLPQEPASPSGYRHVRSLGVQAPLQPYVFHYDEPPADDGEVRLDLLYTGYSAGTELTFLKNTNPYLHARWDDTAGVFVDGEPSARYPLPFMGYMEVARVAASRAPGIADGQIVATTFGHKTGHKARPDNDLLVPLPDSLDPLLGVFVAQMGPIAANGILHADAAICGTHVPALGAGLPGQRVVVWGGGTVGLLTALFARAGGAETVLVAEPSPYRRAIADCMGLHALPEDEAWRAAKSWRSDTGHGADIVFQTRARSESLNLALRSLRPQGRVIDLAFYQGGMTGTRLGEEFHHNALSITCAQIGRVPAGLSPRWTRARLAAETVALLERDGQAIRDHMITHLVPFDDAPAFLTHLVKDRPDFLQIVFGCDA